MPATPTRRRADGPEPADHVRRRGDRGASMRCRDPPAVLVLTMVDDDDTVVAAMRAGARGYVLKGATGDEIAAAVRTVAAGGAVFGAGVARSHPGPRVDARQPSQVRIRAGSPTASARCSTLLADGASNAADRPQPRALPQDRPELRVADPRQAPGRRPHPSRAPGATRAGPRASRRGSLLVGEGGLEPPRPCGHWHLKPARLPFRHSPE